jgi:hypothetical protein
MSDDEIVLATIRRARRRMMVIAFVRTSCLALAIGASGVAAVYVVSRESWALARLLSFASAAALAVAATTTLLRRPTLAQAAATLDSRLGLHDLVVAALALLGNPDAMAMLVVRDAREKLNAIVIPTILALPRGLLAWTCSASVLAAVLAAFLGGTADTLDDRSSDGGTARLVSGGSSTSTRPRSPSAAGTAAELRVTPASPRARRAVAARRERGSGSGSPQPPFERSSTTSPTSQTGNGDTRGTTAASPSGGASGRSGNAGRQSEVAQAKTAPGSGGVQQGRIGAATPADRITRSGEAPSTPRDVRLAAVRAEAALARDEIPPRLKPLVRNYFRAIQFESSR